MSHLVIADRPELSDLAGAMQDVCAEEPRREAPVKSSPAVKLGLAEACVRVGLHRSGDWEIAFSGERERLRCRTLREAQRVANHCASQVGACELVVLDAYHRVLQHGFFTGERQAAALGPR